MRRGYDPKILMDKKGRIFGFATGADACAEHECGSQEMQSTLCQGARMVGSREEANFLATLRRKLSGEKSIIERFLPEKELVYPQLIERKRIDSNLDKLQFVKEELNGVSVAMFGLSKYEKEIRLDHRELNFFKEDVNVAGAWDSGSFAISVRGEKMVKKMEDFAEAIKAGDGIFAGTFLENHDGEHLAGVIIVRDSMLRPEHRAAIGKAQVDFEEKLRLAARSRLPELEALRNEMQRRAKGTHWPGYLWAVWKDGVVDGEVLYALNPSYGIDAPYWGPYDFDQLAKWITTDGTKPALKPVPRA